MTTTAGAMSAYGSRLPRWRRRGRRGSRGRRRCVTSALTSGWKVGVLMPRGSSQGARGGSPAPPHGRRCAASAPPRQESVGLLGRRVELGLDLAFVEGLALPRSGVEDVPEPSLVGVLDRSPLGDRGVRAALLDGRVERLVVVVGVADLLLRRQARREEAQQIGIALLDAVP